MVIRRRKSKTNKQYNSQKKKDKRINNDLQSSYTENKRSSNTKLKKPELNSGVPKGSINVFIVQVLNIDPHVLSVYTCLYSNFAAGNCITTYSRIINKVTRQVPSQTKNCWPFRRTYVHPRSLLLCSCFSICSLLCSVL